MTNEGVFLNKLIILYILDQVGFPLTNSQISQIVLDKGYMDYFNLQLALNEMLDNDFIHVGRQRNQSVFEIAEPGKEAIDLFEIKVSDAIKMDILNYLKEKKIELKNASDITSDYYPSGNEYITQCSIKERNQLLVEIKLTVPNQEQAIHVCDSWQKKCEEIYQYLITEIILD